MRAVSDSEIRQRLDRPRSDARSAPTAFAHLGGARPGLAGGVYRLDQQFHQPGIVSRSSSRSCSCWSSCSAAPIACSVRSIGACVVVLLPELLATLGQYRLLFVGAADARRAAACAGGPRRRDRALVPGEGAADARRSNERTSAAFSRQARSRKRTFGAQISSVSFGGVHAVQRISASTRAPERSPASSARTAPARPPRSTLICGFYRPDAGTVQLGDADRLGAARSSNPAGGHRAHLSDQPAVREHVGHRQRAGRAAPRPARRRLVLRPQRDADERRRRRKPARLRRLSRRDRRARGGARARRQAAGRDRARARRSPRACWRSTNRPPGSTTRTPARSASCSASLRAIGIAVILVEHDMELVMGVSDHVIVLDAGAKIAEGAPRAGRAPIPRCSRPISGAGEHADRAAASARRWPAARRCCRRARFAPATARRTCCAMSRSRSPQGELVAVLGAERRRQVDADARAERTDPAGRRRSALPRRAHRPARRRSHRGARARAGARRPAGVSRAQRDRQSAARRLCAPDPPTRRRRIEALLDRFPRSGAPASARRPSFRRRAADAGDRARPDGAPAGADARRAVARPRAETSGRALRSAWPSCATRARRSCSSTRWPTLALSVADRAYVLQSGAYHAFGQRARSRARIRRWCRPISAITIRIEDQ